MTASLITAFGGVFGLLCLRLAKSNFTKFVIFLLAVSAIATVVNYKGVSTYAPMALGFCSLLASFESTSSYLMEKPQIIFFVLSGLGFFVFSMISILPLEIYLLDWPFLILFFIGFGYHWHNHRRKLWSRLGILVVWSGLAISWFYSLVTSLL
ncbi:hypothetical protein ACV07N_12325 [Roseivirga echinicomitans]